MNTTRSRHASLAAVCCAALAALTLATAGVTAAKADATAAAADSGSPIVTTSDGAVRGVAVPGSTVDVFLGLPYAAPPTGNLRWRPPQPPAHWQGVRDATNFAPSCPQNPTANPFMPPGPTSEDCLYLNVYTPSVRHDASRPVLVWIHGGGLTQDAGRNYDPAELAADGIVAVTINYRLGALGFLAHPALASRPGGPAGNYGLMDQQAALRWVQANIVRFGGNPHNVTIAGESAGGLSVLAHLVSRGSRGLFQRAIIQSGSFALNQQSLADAEAADEDFAAKAGCPDQTAQCLRHLPVSTLLAEQDGAYIPGVVDGEVLTEPIGTALAAGRFARVPILNGTNRDEERIFVSFGRAISGGTNVMIPGGAVTADSYQSDIASVLGVSAAQAAAIAAEYPLASYPSPTVAFSALAGDANFACPALQMDRWTSGRVPTFAYEFNDDAAPLRFTPPLAGPPVATHGSELQYLFDLPNAPVPGTLSTDQQTLATSMRTAWANFAAAGHPATATVPLARIRRRGPHIRAVASPATATARDRLRRDGSQGVQLATIQELARYWATDYDWRACEARLNALPQFTTEIDGVGIHFIHVKSRHENALPLIITHGWPGSVIEMLGVVDPLTDPTAHGGSAEDAFDLVLPSLPGYGFSAAPTEVGWDPGRVARAWAELMNRLGYARYVAQGGDIGASSRAAMLAGCLLLLAGVAVTFGAIATTTAAAFLAGTAVAGAGFGLGFSGAIRMTIALATPSQSAGLVTAIFTVGYLAFSIPALIAGVAATRFGLHSTALAYSASLAVLVAVAAAILLFGPSGKPARPAAPSRAVMPTGPCTGPPCLRATDPPGGNPATTAKTSG